MSLFDKLLIVSCEIVVDVVMNLKDMIENKNNCVIENLCYSNECVIDIFVLLDKLFWIYCVELTLL